MSTGASSDLQRATDMCRRMVTQYGMSDKLGPIYLGGEQEVFLARDFGSQTRNYSEAIASQIDQEIQDALMQAYHRAYDLLSQYRDKLDGLAQLLIEKETIGREEFEAFMAQDTKKENIDAPFDEA